ncbi:MAG: carbohydrate porin [Candidatus Omnitrophica bacterium]|nr:carbohydrate porin [Candidatus Omnitrophota bacterium]
MAVVKKVVLFLLVFSFFCGNSVFADQASLEETVRQLQKRIEALEEKVSQQDKIIAAKNSEDRVQEKKIAEYESKLSEFEVKLHRAPGETMQIMEGLELGAGMTMIVQGANNVNNATSGVDKKKNRTDGSYSADITLAKEFNEVGGRAFLHLEGGQGSGMEDDLTLYSNVNRDADDHENVRVTELWYEQGLFKDKVALTFGKLDPTAYFDQNEVANDETTQFLGRIFRNSPTLEFPDNTAGIRVAYLPKEWIELGYGMFNSNSDNWSKMFDNTFNIGQVTFKTNFLNLAGNYRFYGWNNNAYHRKWMDATKDKENSYGFGLSFDQKVTDTVTAFCRYGWQDPSVYNPDSAFMATGDLNYSLAHSWSSGFQVEGKPWGREKDILAFAVGQVFPSNNYKKTEITDNIISAPRSAKAEGHLEAYYKIHINNHLAISPDFQYIWNPFGTDILEDTNGIFVGGMRAQIDF